MIRVVLVDDHPAILWAVRRLLQQSDDVEVVAEARDGEELLRELNTLEVDVVLLDIHMPRMDGFAVLKALKTMPQSPKVVVLTTNGSTAVQEKALSAGASAFVPKQVAYKELVPAIRRAVG